MIFVGVDSVIQDTQVFGGQNFYGIYKYSGDIPALQPAPGIDTRCEQWLFFQAMTALIA